MMCTSRRSPSGSRWNLAGARNSWVFGFSVTPTVWSITRGFALQLVQFLRLLGRGFAVKPGAPPTRWFVRQRDIGWDGLAMLALSNLVLLATAGLSGLWTLYRVWRIARDTPFAGVDGDWVVVLGARLCRDRVAPGYGRRLRRAAALYHADPRRRILLVGGRTGGSASEAECGREFLRELGIPAASLFIEDQSLNTLENLRHARNCWPRFESVPSCW